MSVRRLVLPLTIIAWMIVSTQSVRSQPWVFRSDAPNTIVGLCPHPSPLKMPVIPEDQRRMRLRFLPSDAFPDVWTIDTVGADSIVRWLADHLHLFPVAEPTYDAEFNIIPVIVKGTITSLDAAITELQAYRLASSYLIPLVDLKHRTTPQPDTVTSTASETTPGFDYGVMERSIDYPLHARRQGIEGRVEVDALIGPTGRVRDIEMSIDSSGPCLLRAEAIDAILRMTYTPVIEHGRPVSSWVSIPIVFVLK
jgi:TonB family protein